MHPDIQKWVYGVLGVSPDGRFDQIDMTSLEKRLGSVISNIVGLVQAGRISDDQIVIKKGLKKTLVSPLIFLANLAEFSSAKAHLTIEVNPQFSGFLSCVANECLYQIGKEAKYLEHTYGDQACNRVGLSHIFKLNEPSLNFVDVLNSVVTQLSFNTESSSFNFDDSEFTQSFFDRKTTLQPMDYSSEYAPRYVGVYAPLLHHALFTSIVDYDEYKNHSSGINPPYLFRLNNHDFVGSSLMLYIMTGEREFSQRRAEAIKYTDMLLDRYSLNSTCSVFYASYPVDPVDLEWTKLVFRELAPVMISAADIDQAQFSKLIGCAYAYTSALGVNPFGDMSVLNHFDGSNKSEAYVMCLERHTKLAFTFGARLQHSDETLQAETEKMQSYYSFEQRI